MTEIIEMMGVSRTAIVESDTTLSGTYGGAIAIKDTLASHRVHRILLVTSAIRMPRALAVFRHLGITSIPAPTDFLTHSRPEADRGRSSGRFCQL
jgi:uncharacterized SAM-binding protein YcdF (DUF218 family)